MSKTGLTMTKAIRLLLSANPDMMNWPVGDVILAVKEEYDLDVHINLVYGVRSKIRKQNGQPSKLKRGRTKGKVGKYSPGRDAIRKLFKKNPDSIHWPTKDIISTIKDEYDIEVADHQIWGIRSNKSMHTKKNENTERKDPKKLARDLYLSCQRNEDLCVRHINDVAQLMEDAKQYGFRIS